MRRRIINYGILCSAAIFILSFPVDASELQNETFKKGWTTTPLNVRKKPSTNSKVLDVLPFNTKVKFIKENKKLVKIKYKNKYAYVYKQYISKKKIKYDLYSVPKYSGYKSWMPYTAITSISSPQYFLQNEYAYTGTYGIRQINGRYCVAIG